MADTNYPTWLIEYDTCDIAGPGLTVPTVCTHLHFSFFHVADNHFLLNSHLITSCTTLSILIDQMRIQISARVLRRTICGRSSRLAVSLRHRLISDKYHLGGSITTLTVHVSSGWHRTGVPVLERLAS
jgi:hypothetical protein